jgi:hypothetical protein
MQIKNIEGFLTVIEDGKEFALGYLMDFAGRGIFDATYGKVDISPEDAKRHNELFDKAMLDALDDRCEVGQGATFYWNGREKTVNTFIGTLVSDKCSEGGNKRKKVVFRRNGKVYSGIVQKDADCINFYRVS